MSKEFKVVFVVAVVEAVLALLVGYILFLAQADSIEKKTIEILSGYFDSVDKDMSYDQVLKFIYEDSKRKDEEISSLTNTNAKLTQKYENILNELTLLKGQISSEETNKATIDSAQSFANSNDYVKALTILNSVISKTPEMEVLINDYKRQYETQIIMYVDTLVSDEKYDDASILINEALKIIPDSSTLAQKKQMVADSKPKTLMSALTPYEVKGYAEKVAGQVMQMGGTKYYNGFQLGTSWESSYAIFNLNSQFKQIAGIVGHIDGSGDADKTVSIFADGILITSIDIDYQNLPQDFTIDVTEVRQLKFERTDGTAQTGFAELIIK